MTPDVDRALLAWPLMASLITIFGTAGFVLLSTGQRAFGFRAAAACLLLLWRVLAPVVFLASLLVFLNLTSDMAGVSWTSAIDLVPEVLTETHAGHVFEWLLPIALAFVLTAYVPLPKSIRPLGLFALGGVQMLLMALLSHAIDKGPLAIAIYFLHETSVGLWVGALLAVSLVTRSAGPDDIWVGHAIRRVSTVAFWSVIVLVITGTYTAYTGLGLDAYRLLYSAYGRTLIAKIIVFAGVLAIGAYNRYWLVPEVHDLPARNALLRNVWVESVTLLIAVTGLATLLANTPPAHGMPSHTGHAMMAMIMVW